MIRSAYIAVTIAIMMIISRFLVRLVDATVQIDDNIFVLLMFLIVVNVMIWVISCKLYRIIEQMEKV